MSETSESDVTASTDTIATLKNRVAELERERRMMRGVLDALPQGVFWKDTDLVFRGCNRAARQAIGLGDDDTKFIGLTDHDMPWNRHALARRTART